MLQLPYQFLMTKLCRTRTLWIVNQFEKRILYVCFTVSMIAHSINILSELKMSSFGPYAWREDALSIRVVVRPVAKGQLSRVSKRLPRVWFSESWLKKTHGVHHGLRGVCRKACMSYEAQLVINNEYVNEISCKVWRSMDQPCNRKTLLAR